MGGKNRHHNTNGGKIMGDEETYKMRFRCCNCGAEFVKDVLKGIRASGMGGKCPYCGINDHTNDAPKYTHVVLGKYTLWN